MSDELELTPEQIEEILDELHEEVQFYNVSGEADNYTVLEQIKTALSSKFIKG